MRVIFLFLLITFSAFAETGAERLARLDAVLQEAETLDNLLARPDLLNLYYDRLAEFYGRDKFQRRAFDAIVMQLQDIKDRVPGLKEALWTPPDPNEAYSIQPETEISGRRLEPNLWKAYHLQQLKHLQREAGNMGPRAQWAKQAREIVAELKLDRQRTEIQIEQTIQGRKAQGIAMALYMASVANNPKARALAAALVLSQMEQPGMANALASSTDADVLLTHIDELRAAIGSETLGVEEALPKELTRMVEERTPNRKVLLESHPDIFPREFRRGRFNPSIEVGTVSQEKIEFLPVHPLHAIFKGISFQECNAGHCGFLAGVDPQRWANSAFPEARLFYVFQGGSYHGFVQRIPIRDPQGNIYANHDFGATVLRNKTLVKRNGQWHVSNLFDLWAEKVAPLLPAGWKGIAQSENEMGDHSDIRKTLLGSTAWQRAKPLGPSTDFTTLDPTFVRKLVAVSPKPGDQTAFGVFPEYVYYGGNGVFDAAVHKQAKNLVLLQPNGQDRPPVYIGPDWGNAPRPPLPAPIESEEMATTVAAEPPKAPCRRTWRWWF